MAFRMIQVGIGRMGAGWCQLYLPPAVANGLIEVVAAVDIRADALAKAQRHLGLRSEQCYTDLGRALDENPADFCSVVVPPAAHEVVVNAALDHELHVLSEKPIADTLVASVRIADRVKAAGKKMAVTMSHRFNQLHTSLRAAVHSGRYGALDRVLCRFTAATRKAGPWGGFQYEIPDPMLVDGAVHHLDLVGALARAPCQTVYAQTWNPPWSEFAGDTQVLAVMRFTNGVRAAYEGAAADAAGLDCWGREYTRAECEHGTLLLRPESVEVWRGPASDAVAAGDRGSAEQLPLLEQPKWGHAWLIDQFVRWLDGGQAPETNVEDNLVSLATVFAAIQSSRTGRAVDVPEFLQRARGEAAT